MASDLNDACLELASALQTLDYLNVKHYADDSVSAPEAQIFTRDYDPRMTFGGTTRPVELGIRVIVPRTPAREAQERLREYMETEGANSVIATVENAGNWAVEVNYVEVTNIGEPFELLLADAVYLAVDFYLTVAL